MSFEPATISVGDISTLTYELDNGASVAATEVSLSDTLPTQMTVASSPNASTTCPGGTVVATAGTGSISYSGGSVVAGATCTVTVAVTSAIAGTYANATERATSSLGASAAAEATLMVNSADAPGFAKAFLPATVAPGEVSTLTFTIDNSANAIAIGTLGFADDFPDGLVVADSPNASTTCTGTVVAPAGGRRISHSGGRVAAGAACMIAVDVVGLRSGTLRNTSDDLTSDLSVTTAGAVATLTVNEAPLSVSMSFEPATISVGDISTLTYELDNGASVAATEVSLSDTLPTQMTVASSPNASTTCPGGTVVATAGTGSISYSGGSVVAGATCTVTVAVTSAIVGTYVNATESVTSALGTSTPAEATLTVNAADAPGFVKVFSPDTIGQGGETQIIFTVDNEANAMEMTGMAFTDDFPNGLVVAGTPNASTTCGGTFDPDAGDMMLSFMGGTLAAGATCEIRVTVRAIGAGTLTNPAINLTSSIATATSESAMLTVDPAEAPGFAKAFSPAMVGLGEISRLTFTIDNAANALEVGSLAFTDDFPDGLVVAGTPNASTTCNGTFDPAASATSLAFTGGSVAARQSCTIAVDVQALRAGALENISGDLTSDLPVATPGVSAILTVNEAPLTVSMSFVSAVINPGGVSRLTYELNNDAAIGATAMSLSDMLPTDLVVAADPNVRNDCGGTLTAAADANMITFMGGLLAAGDRCTIMIDVTSATPGRYVNRTELVISSLGTSTPAQATLIVDQADAPVFTKAFLPDTVDPGDISRLTFTINNSSNLMDAGDLAFTDTFPPGMIVAQNPNAETSCGGTFAPAAGDISLAFAGGSVAAGQSCTLSVDVRALRAGALANQSGALTSDLTVTTPGVSATLTVNEAPLSVSMAFEPTEIAQGGVSRLTYTLENVAAVAATAVALSDMLPTDLVVAADPNVQNDCGGTLTVAAAGTDTITYSGGSLVADSTCTISIAVTSAVAGSYPNETESVTSALGSSTPAQATLIVNAADALGFAKAFSPTTVAPGGISTLTFTIDNLANSIAVGSLAFIDFFPDGLVVADSPSAETTCGGMFAPAASEAGVAFTGGSVAAGQSCTLSVEVQALRSGMLENISNELTSDLPAAHQRAVATLAVNEVPLSVTLSFEPTAIAQGGVSRLTYKLDNGAAIEALEVSLSDTLPDDVVVADLPDAQTTCTDGTLMAAAGSETITFTSGSLAAGGSCTITVDVTSAVAGSYSNSTESVTSSLGDSESAEATLTVNAADAPGFVKAFSPDTIDQGGETQIIFTVDNGANAMEMTGMALSDPLPPGVSVAATPGIVNTCNGTFSPVAGATMLAFADGTLAAGATCEIRVTVRAIEAGTRTNPGIALTSSIATATSPEVTLTVTAAGALGFTKAFSPATVDPGGISRLTFTIDNTANRIAVGTLRFSDFFPDGLVVADSPNAETTCGGTFAPAASVTEVPFTGGSVAAGQSCTLSVEVQALRSGVLENVSGGLTSDLPSANQRAVATLTVNEAPLSVSMSFEPATISVGDISTLTYELGNGASVAATAVALSDTLPTQMTVASSPNASTTCPGGTLVATAGTGSISYSGGSVVAGATCTITVAVTSADAGTYANATERATSSLGASAAAEATLMVNSADAPGFAKAFLPATVAPGEVSTLTFTIDNSVNAIAIGTLGFADDFPDGLVVADSPNASTTCTGTVVAPAGGRRISHSGGSVAAGATCTVAVDVVGLRSGTLRNTSDDLTSDLSVTTAGAVATLTVNEAPLSVSMSFEPATISVGDISTLTYELDNGASVAATEVSLSDTLPDDVVVADLPDAQTTCTGGTLVATAGTGSISYSGGSVAAGATCTVTVAVTSAIVGTYANATEPVTSSLGTSAAAEATLTVTAAGAPVFTKAFSPDTVDPGDISRLTFTINNSSNLMDAGDLAFTDTFPPGMIVARNPNAETNCGGTFAPSARGLSLTFSGGRVAAGTTCTVAVDVVGLRSGTLMNTSGELSSDLPMTTPTPGARAMLTVDEEPLTVSMMFEPATISVGEVSRLTYGLSQTAPLTLLIELSDTLPDGVVVADPPNASTDCLSGDMTIGPVPGMVNATAGGNSISFSNGALGNPDLDLENPVTDCMITVDVTSTVAGSYPNETERVTSALGTSASATATLTVESLGALGFTKAFSPDTVDPGGISTLTFTIDNLANSIEVGSLAFIDIFPEGMIVADTPNASTNCTGATYAPRPRAVGFSFTGGSIAAGQSCTISVDVQALRPGMLESGSTGLTSDLSVASAAAVTLMVNEAPLSVSMAFEPTEIAQGSVSRLTYELNNGAAVEATAVSLSDMLPTDLVVAADPNVQNDCGGTLTVAAAGTDTITYSGGSLAADSTCTISIAVTSTVVGSYPNETESVTSALGSSTPAQATLIVNAADALGFAKAFSPTTVAPGGISTLTFTIDNLANSIAVGSLAFIDFFPDGLVVADSPNASTTCGGTFAPAASENGVAFTGGSVAAGQSCTLSVEVQVLRSGILESTSGELTSDLPAAHQRAVATLAVNEVPLSVTLSFEPTAIAQGGVSRLTYKLDNGAAIEALEVSLSDTLPDDVVVADLPDAQTTCTDGTLVATAGTGSISYSGGSVAAGATCTITVAVTSADAGIYTNTIESVTSALGTSTPAQATLMVHSVGALGFAKAFSPATVAPGGISTLTFTIDNAVNFFEVGSLAFDDNFPTGLVVAATPNASTTCGGTFAPAVSATSLVFSGGSVAADATCTLSVDVQALRVGTLSNLSGDLASDLSVTTPGASATLTVNEVPLSVSMAFEPTAIAQGGVSRLTYKLDNGAAIEASEVSLSDTLPDDVVVADLPDAQTTCTDGTLTAAAGSGTITFTSGSLAAGGSCTISIDMTSAVAGSYSNETESVTSSLGDSESAEATLTVNAADAPGFVKAFSPDTIGQGGETQIIFTVDNGANAMEMTGMAFDDPLPPGVSVAATPGIVNTCNGTFSPVAGATMLALADGTLAAGATCEIRVTVRAIEAGTRTNPGIALTSSIATATSPEATLTVTAAGAPVFTKAFSPATVDPGGISRLTFTIDNLANAIEVGSLGFADDFPDGLVVADSPNAMTTCGGTVVAPAGGDDGRITHTGGTVAAGETCTIAVDVQALRAGTLANQSGALTSDLPMTTPGASATLVVNEAPLSVSMMFEPTEIAQGGVSRLTYTLENVAAVAATSVALSDPLPEDVVVASTPSASTTCTDGTLTATADTTTITFTGGTLAAGVACTISVDVSSARTGSYLNPTGSVTSSLGTSTPAQATLTVDSVDALGFTKEFSPATVDPGGVSTLTFTIDNLANAVEVGSLGFADDFPDGLVVADSPNAMTTCGGTVVAPVGGDDGRITHTGGTVAAGETCTIAVDVQAERSGTLRNISGELTSDLPMTTPGASATLVVNEAPLSVSMMFEPTEIAQGGVSRLTYTLENVAAVAATSVALSDPLPEDVVVASTPSASTTCTDGTLTATADTTTITFTGGTLAAGVACTISVDVSSAHTGSYLNPTGSVTSSLGTSTPAQATLTVDSVDALGFTKEFSPATVDPGGVSTLTFTIDNLANAIEVGSLGFVDDFPDGLVVADSPNAMTTCGGTVVAPAGGDDGRITHTGGTVAAGETCTIAVDVQALRAGALANQSGALTSDLPMTTPGASATLVVNEAPLSVSMMFEPTEIAQGGVSRLTYTLENGAAVAATSVALSNPLPEDVVVASNPNAVTTCTGGTLTAVASGTSIEYSGGAVDASGSCMITVAVTSRAVGSHANSTASVASSLGTSVAAEATLTVEEAESGTVTFNVESDIDGTFGFSTSEPDLAASLAVSDGTGSTGALPVAAGSHSVAVAGPRGAVLAAIDCDDTDSTADVSAETISLVVDALEDVTCTITVQSSIAEAIKTINSFLTRRADLVLSSEPDPQRRFDRLKDGSGNASRLRLSGEDLEAFSLFTAQGSRGDYQASTSLLQARQAAASATLARGSSVKDAAYVENYRFDAWFDGQYKEFDDGANGDGYFAIAYAGVDYLLTPDILLGTVVSFDSMEEKTATSTASGFGWMVGPQLTARLGSHLYFDGRIAAGRSENRVSPFNTYTDDFWTWRWLSSASLTGEFQYDNWTIRPHTSLSYFEERQKSYVDSLGAEIPGQTVRLGQLKLGPTFIGHFESAEGQVYSPYLTVDAIYNLGDTTGVTLLEPDRPEVEGWRGNLEAGVSMVTDGGSRLSLGASYDGLGQSDFEAWGVMLEFSSPIGKSKMR